MPSNDKPTILYDGDCGFCKRWIKKFQNWTGESVVYLPYQEALIQFPMVSEVQCKKAVQFISNDNVCSGAEAVFRALNEGNRYSFLLKWYEKCSLFRKISEGIYFLVARNRTFFSKMLK